MSSAPTAAAAKVRATAARRPTARPSSGRAVGSRTSYASAPAHTKIAPSSTPASCATASEHITSAAAWSTNGNVFMRFVYGSEISRLSVVGVASSSAVVRCREPRARVRRRHVGEAGHEPGDECSLLGEAATGIGREDALEQRVDDGRVREPRLHLGPAHVALLRAAHDRVGGTTVRVALVGAEPDPTVASTGGARPTVPPPRRRSASHRGPRARCPQPRASRATVGCCHRRTSSHSARRAAPVASRPRWRPSRSPERTTSTASSPAGCAARRHVMHRARRAPRAPRGRRPARSRRVRAPDRLR